MRWFLALLAVLCILSLSIAACAASVKPGDLSLDITIDPAPRPAAIEDRAIRSITFTVAKKTNDPISGKIVLRYPEEFDPRGRLTQVIDYDLTKDKSVSILNSILIPKNTPLGQFKFPVEMFVGDQKYMEMNLLVSKSLEWAYIAPFEGGYNTSHDKAFPPEKKLDFSATYTGFKGRKIAWQSFPATAINPDSMFEFHALFPTLEQVTGYAVTNIYADDEIPASLLVGSDDSIKIWQNGKLVHNNYIMRGSGKAQDKVDIVLAKGKNTFLLKVTQYDGGWGFHFDIVDRNEKPIPGLKYDIAVRRAFITDPMLRLADVTRNSALLTWESDVPAQSKIIIREAETGRTLVYGETPKSEMIKPKAGIKPLVFEDKTLTANHKYTVTGLKPGTRYLISVTPAIGGKESEPIAFYTAPPSGKTMYVKLKMINIIFSNVTPEKDSHREGATTPVPQQEIERVIRECELASMFYWINSGMRFFLENEYIVTDKYYAIENDSLYGVGYSEGAPDEKALEELLAARGKKVSDYDGRNFISMEKRWDENTKQWKYPSSGGGTIGPEDKPGYGKSAWKGGSQNSWLYTHECGHQFDALYHWSGGPEFIFNHPQPWDDTAHRFGNHYDCNAWIAKEWAGYVSREHQGWPYLEPTKWHRYFICRWGTVQFVDDADNDGIPDNDPSVPLDEVRWGTDPTKTDTDGDGLSDLLEAMACQWVDYGLDEIWAGPVESHRCDPRKPDTDGDGIIDGEDPYPLYSVSPDLAYRTPTFDGIVSDGEYLPFITMEDPAYNADFFMSWDENYLYIACKAEEVPAGMTVYLDMDDDGWYRGH
ncbi:MAG TPA: hypothetical protein PKV43_06020, partial [Armatimonadota bacterium]|nr:hypothetical protein [Armatimonadota bacterium]